MAASPQLDGKAMVLLALAAVAITLSFYAPVINLFLMGGNAPGGALGAARSYLFEPLFWRAAGVTFAISIATTAAVMVLAVPVALFIAHCRSAAERVLIAIVVSSLFSSILLRTFAWFVLLGRNGPVAQLWAALTHQAPQTLLFTQGAVVLGMTHILLPTAILIIWSRARLLAQRQRALAETLGASTLFYMTRVALRANAGVLAVAALLIFVLALGFAITPILLGGGGGQTMMIGVLIDEQVNRFGNWDRGAALSLLMLGLIAMAAVSVWLLGRLLSRKPS